MPARIYILWFTIFAIVFCVSSLTGIVPEMVVSAMTVVVLPVAFICQILYCWIIAHKEKKEVNSAA